ncbi:MAG: glutamate--tRNA ligase family protein [bacterium]
MPNNSDNTHSRLDDAQLERLHLYAAKLAELVGHNKVYRCFCRRDVLEEKQYAQLQAGKLARYDRTCGILAKEKIQRKIDAKLPYIWRLVINDQQIFEVRDRSRGKVLIEMCNFTDFPLTNYDGSFTPVFMSFIDDWLVFNTPIICVRESLADTAFRVALYDAFMLKIPAFSQISDK